MNPFLLVALVSGMMMLIVILMLVWSSLRRHLGPVHGPRAFRRRAPLVIAAVALGTILGMAAIGLRGTGAEAVIEVGPWVFLGLVSVALPVHLYRVRRLGKVVLRLPRSGMSLLSLLSSVVFLVVGISGILFPWGDDGVSPGWLGLGILGLTTAAFGFQVRERGLVALDDVLPAASIRSFEWMGDGDGPRAVLRVETRGRLPFWREKLWALPRDFQSEVSRELERLTAGPAESYPG